MTRDYLGIGVAHPAQVSIYGQQQLTGDVALIRQSIARILATPVGTQFMHRDFGSYLHLIRFDQNDLVQQNLLEYYISEAITKWEKRVRYLDTTFSSPAFGQLSAEIQFEIVATSDTGTLVYPFYQVPLL